MSELSAFPFVRRQMEQNPELFRKYQSYEAFNLEVDWIEFKKANQYKEIHSLLRQYRNSRLALIGWHDLSLPTSAHGLSLKRVTSLAEILLKAAYDFVFEKMLQKYGQLLSGDGSVIQLCVYALGKLGACELNYSSDLDLVFLYDDEGQSSGDRSLSAQQWCERFGRQLIGLLDTPTADGIVYRVDMRLRPYGSAAALTCSIQSFFNYLYTEGREWERMAWMRARLVCGRHINASAFNEELNGFIYRRHLDYSILTALAKIQTDLLNEAGDTLTDLKFGYGGIRELEFSIQSMQLIFAGRKPELQGHILSKQISLFTDNGLLDESVSKQLSYAWLLLRRLENLCQLQADLSVHKLPDNEEDLDAFAMAMNFSSGLKLKSELLSSQTAVHTHFRELFKEFNSADPVSKEDQKTAQELAKNASTKRVGKSTEELIYQIMQQVVVLTKQLSVYKRICALIRSINRRPNYLLMLQKEPLVLERLIYLFDSHEYFSIQLTNHPVLLELLFEHQNVPERFDETFMYEFWEKTVSTGNDEERWLDEARIYKATVTFLIMQGYCENKISVQQSASYLTLLAHFIVNKTTIRAWQETQQKLPNSNVKPDALLIIAYGSMATHSMHLNSDLDLVFLYDIEQVQTHHTLFLQKWIRRLIHYLNVHTHHGRLYEIDMQLRPNGNSGALLSGIKEFENYQKNQAWVWEHAALVKSCVVYASHHLTEQFNHIRHTVLTTQVSDEKVDLAIKDMLQKMNTINGSAHADLQLLGIILKCAHEFPQLTSQALWFQMLSELKVLGCIDGACEANWKKHFITTLVNKFDHA